MKNVDLVLRILYCAVAPVVLGGFATQVPVGGIALGAIVATALAVTEGQAWRDRVGRVPVIGRPFRGPGRLGAFYRDHPPKPLIFYIVYPVLLPYVLARKALRLEWRLYRKSGAIALVILVVTAVVEYLRKWRPELSVGFFLTNFAVTLLFQILLTMIVIMPVVTTILLAHARPRRVWIRTLAVVVTLGAALGGFIVVHNTTPSVMLDRRLYARGRIEHKRAVGVLHDAAVRALAALPPDAPEGLVHGPAVSAAHAELRRLWKPDEAAEFRVWTTPSPRIVVVIEVSKHHPPIAVAVDSRGADTHNVPPAGVELLKKTKLPR